MKLTVNKFELSECLKNINNLIDSNNINPILSSVNIKTEKDKLILTATNGSSSYKQTLLKIKIINEGNILIKARFLFNIINKLDQEEITLNQIDDNILQIKDKNFSCEINLIENYSYPIINFEFNDWKKIEISHKVISDIVYKISPFIINDINNSFSVLSGIWFNPINETTMECASTDTCRASYLKFNYKGDMVGFVIAAESIRMVNEILSTQKNKNFEIYINNKNIIFKFTEILVSFSLYDFKTYPDITKTLLKQQKYFFTIKTNNLLKALNRGAIFVSNEKKPVVNLKISNNILNLKFINNETGNSFEEIEILDKNINDLNIKFNEKLLIDFINIISSETITFNCDGENSLVTIKNNDPNYLGLIMPHKSV